MNNWMHFNLNSEVRVMLTDLGYQRLADTHNAFVKIIPSFEIRDANYYKAKADDEGYTTFQMWVFMQEFGEVVSNGGPIYFNSNVLIESKE